MRVPELAKQFRVRAPPARLEAYPLTIPTTQETRLSALRPVNEFVRRPRPRSLPSPSARLTLCPRCAV